MHDVSKKCDSGLALLRGQTRRSSSRTKRCRSVVSSQIPANRLGCTGA